MKRFFLLSSMLLAVSSSAFAGNVWERAFVQEACTNICQRNGSNAVEAGVHSTGGRFYTCMAGDGRPGYQLLGYANNQCAIGTGGKEVGYGSFYCLCTTESGKTVIRN